MLVLRSPNILKTAFIAIFLIKKGVTPEAYAKSQASEELSDKINLTNMLDELIKFGKVDNNLSLLNSNYNDMTIELTTTAGDKPLYFSTINENGEKVYYDWQYNQITQEQAEEIRKQYINQ